MSTLEALAFGLDDLHHVLLPLGLACPWLWVPWSWSNRNLPLSTQVLLTLYWTLVDLGHDGLGRGPAILRMRPWPGDGGYVAMLATALVLQCWPLFFGSRLEMMVCGNCFPWTCS